MAELCACLCYKLPFHYELGALDLSVLIGSDTEPESKIMNFCYK